jgi:NitT/TauT family transport system substrate-binding protein
MEGAFMSCCDLSTNDNSASDASGHTGSKFTGSQFTTPIGRRTVLKGMVGTVAGFVLGGSGFGLAQNRRIRLAFCSQLLCVVPYEFTRAQGFFQDEGLNVELVYTRGGGAALQALVGGAVEYAATSFDAALQAYSNGARIRRFATTGRLPLFALATAPRRVDEIKDFGDLAGRTVGVSALGNGDHVLMLYLLERAGVDPRSVQFATLGVNLYDALRLGQVDAGWVQEPSLTLIREAGGGVLFNAMDIDQAQRYLGGAYEFMGVAVRADELDARLEEMRALSRALERGLIALKQAPAAELVAALPSELVAGGDLAQLEQILEEHRASLYPDTVTIDVEAVERVVKSQRAAGVLEEPVDLSELLATGVLGGSGG